MKIAIMEAAVVDLIWRKKKGEISMKVLSEWYLIDLLLSTAKNN